jgi:hypothetical protein
LLELGIPFKAFCGFHVFFEVNHLFAVDFAVLKKGLSDSWRSFFLTNQVLKGFPCYDFIAAFFPMNCASFCCL